MFTKEDRIYQHISHAVMILLSLNVIVPMALLVISSFTDNDTLIRNGYSFSRKSSASMRTSIFSVQETPCCAPMAFPCCLLPSVLRFLWP